MGYLKINGYEFETIIEELERAAGHDQSVGVKTGTLLAVADFLKENTEFISETFNVTGITEE